MPSAAITVKGQTTIPKKIRDHLNLHAGDQLDFVIKDSGKGDLADYLIGRINQAEKCTTTITLDRDLKGSSIFRLLE